MSDLPLRELERRFRASGATEDEEAWLRARILVGDLEPKRLELARTLRRVASETSDCGSVLDAVDADANQDLAPKFAALRRAGLALLRLALSDQRAPDSGLKLPELLSLAELTEFQDRSRTLKFETGWEAISHDSEVFEDEFGATPLLVGFHDYFASAYIDNLNAARAGLEALGGRCAKEAINAVLDDVGGWLLGYWDPVRSRVQGASATTSPRRA